MSQSYLTVRRLAMGRKAAAAKDAAPMICGSEEVPIDFRGV